MSAKTKQAQSTLHYLVIERSDRPFKFVQLFLRTRALAKKLGLSSYVLLNAAQRILDE